MGSSLSCRKGTFAYVHKGMSALGSYVVASTVSLRGLKRFGSAISLSGVVNFGSIHELTCLNQLQLGSSLSIRNTLRGSFVKSSNTYNYNMSIFNYVILSSTISLRQQEQAVGPEKGSTKVRLGSGISIFGLGKCITFHRSDCMEWYPGNEYQPAEWIWRSGDSGEADKTSSHSILHSVQFGSSISVRGFTCFGGDRRCSVTGFMN